MDETNRKTGNAICVVLIVILAVIIGVLVYLSRKEEMQETERLQRIADEVQPREAKLRDLEEELGEMERQVSYASDTARIMVGFVVSERDDMDDIRVLATEYGFSPVLVLNCALDAGAVADRIALAAGTDWEIMLTASPFSGKAIDAARSGLQDAGLQDSGVFLLRNDDYSVNHTKMLLEKGFIGYTRYHESVPTDGCTDDPMAYFDYSYIQTAETTVGNRLAALYDSKASLILVFDMDAVNRGALPEEEIANILDLTRNYVDQDDCIYASVGEVVAGLLEAGTIEAERSDEYGQYAAGQQERVKELRKDIEEVYEENP